jgi:heavy metal sensor kinase
VIVLSIRQRLTAWYTLVLIIMLLAFAAVIFFGSIYQWQLSADRELLRTARLLGDSLLRSENPVVVDISYRLLTPDGQVLQTVGLPGPHVPVTVAALTAAGQGQTWHETLMIDPFLPDGRRAFPLPSRLRILTVPLGQPARYILQVGKTAEDVQRLRVLLVTTLLIALGLGLPAAALGGWWLAGRALAPVRAMTETARRIEAANLAERLPAAERRDELGQLAATVNSLLDRLQAAFQRERRFTADVSHDLRTPLALAKSTIGVALNRPRSAAELSAALAEVDGHIDRVTGLLDATLFLAHADAEQLQRDYVSVDLSELLTDLFETTVGYAREEHDQTLACDIAPGLVVHGDRDQLTRLFLNLLDNAMQYTLRGGEIRLTARPDGSRAVVTVQDSGVGIAAEDLPHVFDRFYRADKARASGTADHYGLGLSIAQAIARAHGGEITVSSTLGQGSKFTVSLPMKK